MTNAWATRLRDPRFGLAFVSAFTAIVMSAHWAPMAVPGVVVLGLAVLRPQAVIRPLVWWVMAASWSAAVILASDRMEDHVYLFVVWLVALALCLGHNGDSFTDHVAWHARMLIGITFTAAVAWKVYFNEFVSGLTLWLFIVVDHRFAPLATVIGLPEGTIEEDRAALTDLLAGTGAAVSPGASSAVMWRIVAVSVLALAVEAVVAVSHLAADSSRLSTLRLPSVVAFALLTYAVVPVLPFAVLLAVLALAVARWQREKLWVFPVIVMVTLLRLVLGLTI